MFHSKCTIQAFMRITIYQQQSMCQWPESQTHGLIILYLVSMHGNVKHKTLPLNSKAYDTDIIWL